MLNWAPRYTLDAALLETIDWYRDYFAAPRPAAGRAA
jgi:hypothetical protein